jgi:hypothetical protein
MEIIMKKLILICTLLLNIACIAQEDKTVTLTVSGTGKTIEEAKTNALRSSIEQAFGAFISSKTEILNDNLVKDEIVSVANGNVQKYDVISQIELPNVGYAITLSATVSISKLTSFAVSKGVEVEFKGGMFAQNIKLQKLNEESEEKATKNLVEVYTQLLENSFDFSLVSSEPVLVKDKSDVYKIKFNVNTVVNDNYNNFIKYFKETLGKVQATEDEAKNIISVGKPIFYLIIDEKVYKFRSMNSFRNVSKFFIVSQLLSTSFKVTSNIAIYKYTFKNIFRYHYDDSVYGDFLFTKQSNLSLLEARVVPFRKVYTDGFNLDLEEFNYYKRQIQGSGYLAALFPFFIENGIQYKTLTELFNIEICPIPYWSDSPESKYQSIYTKFRNEKMKKYFYQSHFAINIDDLVYFNTKFNAPTYTYEVNLNLSELEKITSFKIEKVPFLEYINNLANYVELENKQ